MKKYTITTSKAYGVEVAAQLKEAGAVCKYATDLDPYLLFVETDDRHALEALDFVVKVRESRSFTLHV